MSPLSREEEEIQTGLPAYRMTSPSDVCVRSRERASCALPFSEGGGFIWEGDLVSGITMGPSDLSQT